MANLSDMPGMSGSKTKRNPKRRVPKSHENLIPDSVKADMEKMTRGVQQMAQASAPFHFFSLYADDLMQAVEELKNSGSSSGIPPLSDRFKKWLDKRKKKSKKTTTHAHVSVVVGEFSNDTAKEKFSVGDRVADDFSCDVKTRAVTEKMARELVFDPQKLLNMAQVYEGVKVSDVQVKASEIDQETYEGKIVLSVTVGVVDNSNNPDSSPNGSVSNKTGSIEKTVPEIIDFVHAESGAHISSLTREHTFHGTKKPDGKTHWNPSYIDLNEHHESHGPNYVVMSPASQLRITPDRTEARRVVKVTPRYQNAASHDIDVRVQEYAIINGERFARESPDDSLTITVPSQVDNQTGETFYDPDGVIVQKLRSQHEGHGWVVEDVEVTVDGESATAVVTKRPVDHTFSTHKAQPTADDPTGEKSLFLGVYPAGYRESDDVDLSDEERNLFSSLSRRATDALAELSGTDPRYPDDHWDLMFDVCADSAERGKPTKSRARRKLCAACTWSDFRREILLPRRKRTFTHPRSTGNVVQGATKDFMLNGNHSYTHVSAAVVVNAVDLDDAGAGSVEYSVHTFWFGPKTK